MADYNFTVKNHYQPFSMQEMLTPFLMYNEAYEKVDEAYTELQKKADVFSNLAESLPGQSKAAEIYNGYANDLRAQAEDLARNGLSMNNRRALSSLKRRYEGEIGRLDRANTTFQEVLKARRAAQEQGLPMLYATNNLTIDSFLDNETPNMFGINSNELYTRGAAIGKSLSSREYGFGEGQSVIGGLYRDIVQTQGIRNAGEFMRRPEVQAYIDKVLEARGVTGNLSGEDYMRARQSLENGIYEGIVYSETHNPKRDENRLSVKDAIDTDLAYKRLSLETAKYQDERNAKYEIDPKTGKVIGLKDTTGTSGGGLAGTSGLLPITPMNIYTAEEKKDAGSNISKYSQYFVKDANGGYKLSKKGLEEYRRTYNPSAGNPYATMYKTEKSDFRKFIDSLGGEKFLSNGKVQPGNVGNLWADYLKSSEGNSFDSTRRTEYSFRPNKEMAERLKESVQTALIGIDKLDEVELDPKTGKFQKVGSMNMKDFQDDKVIIEDQRCSPYGNTIIIKDKDGKRRRLGLPYGIDPYNEQNRDRAMEALVIAQKALSTGKIVENGVEVPLSDVQMAALQEEYKRLMQSVYDHNSQLYSKNKIKDFEYGSFGY